MSLLKSGVIIQHRIQTLMSVKLLFAGKKKKSRTAVVEVQETGHIRVDDHKKEEVQQSAVPTIGVRDDQVLT